MAVGTGGQGGGAIAPPPNILPTKKFKSLKITTYKSVYSNKDKIGFKFSGYCKSHINLCTKSYPFDMKV